MTASTTKRCARCKETLPVERFSRSRKEPCGRVSNCKSCMTDRYREWREADPLFNRRRHLRTRYGMTLEQYEERLVAQGGRCAICGAQPGERVLHVDHDHDCCPSATSCGGCIRGLLCDDCNRGIGMFVDDPLLLEAAARYLRTHALGTGEL